VRVDAAGDSCFFVIKVLVELEAVVAEVCFGTELLELKQSRRDKKTESIEKTEK